MYYLFDTCTTRCSINGRTRPRGRSHLRIVPIGSDNTRTKCSKPDPALKLPPIFLSLPAERDWKIEAQKAFRSAAIHFCSFPRQCSPILCWSSTARRILLGATDYHARCIRPIRECHSLQTMRIGAFSPIQDAATSARFYANFTRSLSRFQRLLRDKQYIQTKRILSGMMEIFSFDNS